MDGHKLFHTTSADLQKALVARLHCQERIEDPNTKDDVQAEKRRLKDYERIAVGAMMGEEIATLPDDCLQILRRAFACYCGPLEWSEWLTYVFPRPDPSEQTKLRADVLRSYGIG